MTLVFSFVSFINISDINDCKSDYFAFITKSYASGAADGTCSDGGPGGNGTGGGAGDTNGDGILTTADCPAGTYYIRIGGYCSICLPNSYYDVNTQACYYNSVIWSAWTNYCTGPSDPNGHIYQIWQYRTNDRNYTEYRFTGSSCLPPPPTVNIRFQ